jgi:hypothetical protein
MEQIQHPLHDLAYSINPKYYDEVYLAKFGGKSRAPHKDGEVVDGFSTIIFKI